ncbi:MAG: (d)CMP kinase, partial [Pseudomonadales bacterium]|nr:(d)CMP kinase [Pseudomonadales bacterium]
MTATDWPIITIDGPTSSGKGTIARAVARALGWNLLDSGALYRLVALSGAMRGLDPDDVKSHAALAAGMKVEFLTDADGAERVLLAGEDV